ncbi:sulfotransferase 16 [Tanacetum coccineum]
MAPSTSLNLYTPLTVNPDNSINDPLSISNSDHPGMVLTQTPFNGGNFLVWSKNIKIALGAKLKLGFIDGTCMKSVVTDVNYQRLHKSYGKKSLKDMVKDKFLEMNSRSKLMQFLMKLSDEYEAVRSQISGIDPLPNMNKVMDMSNTQKSSKRTRER